MNKVVPYTVIVHPIWTKWFHIGM